MSRPRERAGRALRPTPQMMRFYEFMLLLLCIVRLIAYMTVHPRINFLLATMAESADEVFHFFISFGLMCA